MLIRGLITSQRVPKNFESLQFQVLITLYTLELALLLWLSLE